MFCECLCMCPANRPEDLPVSTCYLCAVCVCMNSVYMCLLCMVAIRIVSVFNNKNTVN